MFFNSGLTTFNTSICKYLESDTRIKTSPGLKLKLDFNNSCLCLRGPMIVFS